MATTTEFSEETELTKAVAEIMAADPRLAKLKEQDVHVAACFCIREDENKEIKPCTGEAVKLRKIGPELRVFTKKPIYFLLVVDYGFWQEREATPVRRQYELHRVLSRIEVTRKDNGELKTSIRPWEIQDNVASLRQYGICTPAQATYIEVSRSARTLIDMAAAVVEQQQQRRAQAADEEPDPTATKAPEKKSKSPAPKPKSVEPATVPETAPPPTTTPEAPADEDLRLPPRRARRWRSRSARSVTR